MQSHVTHEVFTCQLSTLYFGDFEPNLNDKEDVGMDTSYHRAERSGGDPFLATAKVGVFIYVQPLFDVSEVF